jgi:subtilisin family serine protease
VAAFSGIAKEASIIALQVFHRSTSGCSADTDYVCASTSDILAALEVVLSRRALYSIAAVNMSLGGGKYTTYCDSSFPSYASLISSLRSYNIPVIIASGNDYYSDGIAEPACISSAISVGATSKYDDRVQSFSNSASILTLLAPGSSIQSSVPGGAYSYKAGTSMATPHIAGAFAVLKQRNSISAISALLDVFASTGMPVYDSRNGLTRPRIQLDAAVNDILAVPPADCPATSTPTQLHCFLTSIGGTTKYKVTVTAIADGINNNDSWMALNMYAAGVPCNSNFGVHYGIDNQTKVTGTCTVMVPSRKPLDHYYGMLVNAEAPNHIADGHSITATVLPQGFTPDDVIFQDGLDQPYP